MAQSKAWTALPSWVVYPVGLLPAVYYFWAAVANQLGADPLAVLENALGEWALIFIVVSLSITPFMRLLKINLVKYRRAVGLVAFAYVALHLSVYLWLDRQFDWWAIWSDILKRPYITVGTAAFLMLLPLALTSNNFSIQKMGMVAWRNLHRLFYPAALCGAIHYVMLEKTWQAEPLIYLVLIVVLLGWRYVRKLLRPA